MARIRKTARVIAAPSVEQCRTFVQLRNFYKRTFGITLHTADEQAVNAMLARKSPPGACPVVYVLEAIKMHFNSKDRVSKHEPMPGVYYYLNGSSGSPCKADTVFSPRNKDDPALCVEKEWGQCKQYADPELSKDVFHELEQDFRSDLSLACRRAPALTHALRNKPKAAVEKRYISARFSTKDKYMARKHIYAGYYTKHLKGIAKARFLQHRNAIAQCPIPLTVIGRDYDGPKTKLADGKTLYTSVEVTHRTLVERARDMQFSFGHMYVLMGALKNCLGDFGARLR